MTSTGRINLNVDAHATVDYASLPVSTPEQEHAIRSAQTPDMAQREQRQRDKKAMKRQQPVLSQSPVMTAQELAEAARRMKTQEEQERHNYHHRQGPAQGHGLSM